MGNSCMAASSMEWDGEDWESLKQPKPCSSSSSSSSSKVFNEAAYLDHHQNKEIDVLGKLRASCDANGKVTLKISKCQLAELLGAIQHNNNNSHQQQMKKKIKELASAEQVLYRLIKVRNQEFANKHHDISHWKPMLETIHEY